jgi:hypothetical protein
LESAREIEQQVCRRAVARYAEPKPMPVGLFEDDGADLVQLVVRQIAGRQGD